MPSRRQNVIEKIVSGNMTLLDWILMPICLFFAGAIPWFIIVPVIFGHRKPNRDDWIGMDK